jgi:hypothetical protein
LTVIQEDVLHFIQTSIRSIWDLEILLFLARKQATSWSVDSLVRELRASVLIVTEALVGLRAAGVVEEVRNAYRYRPTTPELDTVVQRLQQAYAEYPVAVTQVVFAAPNNKIQVFADAFRIKKG